MCIIIACKETQYIPKEDILTQCFNANPHGSGFMIGYRYSVHVEKGIFSLKEFLLTLKVLREQKLSSPIIIHCRLATSGKKDANNCHPFKLNKSVAFCHNGILSIQGNKEQSDTNILSGLLKNIPAKFYQNDNFLDLLDLYCKSDTSYNNKFVFLINKKIHICNESMGFWNKEKTVWFSNDNWKPWNEKKWVSKNSIFSYAKKKYPYQTGNKDDIHLCLICGLPYEYDEKFIDNAICDDCYFAEKV